MNPYQHLDDKDVKVEFFDFGKLQTETGVLSTSGYENMIQVGSWIIGIDNIKSVTEIQS